MWPRKHQWNMSTYKGSIHKFYTSKPYDLLSKRPALRTYPTLLFEISHEKILFAMGAVHDAWVSLV